MTREEANTVARDYVSRMGERSGIQLEIVDELAMERDFGWVFFYDSKAFIDTGEPEHAIGGNAPVIVDRDTGQLYETGTSHDVEHYITEFERIRGKAMSEEKLRSYASMWTTDRHRYGLLEVAPGARISCLVFDLASMAPMTIDDDDDVVAEIIDNMRRAGVRELTNDETTPR